MHVANLLLSRNATIDATAGTHRVAASRARKLTERTVAIGGHVPCTLHAVHLLLVFPRDFLRGLGMVTSGFPLHSGLEGLALSRFESLCELGMRQWAHAE